MASQHQLKVFGPINEWSVSRLKSIIFHENLDHGIKIKSTFAK